MIEWLRLHWQDLLGWSYLAYHFLVGVSTTIGVILDFKENGREDNSMMPMANRLEGSPEGIIFLGWVIGPQLLILFGAFMAVRFVAYLIFSPVVAGWRNTKKRVWLDDPQNFREHWKRFMREAIEVP